MESTQNIQIKWICTKKRLEFISDVAKPHQVWIWTIFMWTFMCIFLHRNFFISIYSCFSNAEHGNKQGQLRYGACSGHPIVTPWFSRRKYCFFMVSLLRKYLSFQSEWLFRVLIVTLWAGQELWWANVVHGSYFGSGKVSNYGSSVTLFYWAYPLKLLSAAKSPRVSPKLQPGKHKSAQPPMLILCFHLQTKTIE